MTRPPMTWPPMIRPPMTLPSTRRLGWTAAAAAVLALAGCTNLPVDQRTQGAIVGGATGAAVGSLFGGGSGKIVATGVGAVVGSIAGAELADQRRTR